MAKYQVPQFIGTESKIVGPFTFKQFIYILGGAVVLFISQYFVTISTLYYLAIPVAAISFSLAFLKIDGTPLPEYLLKAVAFSFGSKKYIYHKEDNNEYIDSLLNKQK